MRFLHTGDWHVGRRIRGRLRDDELEAALDQVVEVARDRAVDAVLVAGDVWDQKISSPESDALVFETLVRLRAAGAKVVLIAGNHDSPQRLEALSKLLEPLGINCVPKVVRPAEGGVIEVPARDGSHAALVACVPFVPERRFSDAAALFDDRAAGYSAYDEGMGAVLAGYAAAFRPDRVNVVMAHLMISGARVGGGENELTIGLTYAVSPTRVPGTASYVALGHVHRPQDVPAAPAPTRFAGSLLQLDFGERGQEKSVAVVDVEPGRPPTVEAVPVRAGRALREVRGTLDELVAQADHVGDAYLRVIVRTNGPVPGIADQVRAILPNAVDIHLDYEPTDVLTEASLLRTLSPREQFRNYYRAAHDVEEPPDATMAAFDRVYEDVEGGPVEPAEAAV